MFDKLLRPINGQAPPDKFLWRLLVWGFDAPGVLFEKNNVFDIYSSVSEELGPYTDEGYRRCAMLECMLVLAKFESSYGKDIGVDTTNPLSVSNPVRAEAGIWQVSADSMNLDPRLKAMVAKRAGGTSIAQFQSAMRNDWFLAADYIAQLLRVTVKHNGPARDKKINPWLRKDRVEEFRTMLLKM